MIHFILAGENLPFTISLALMLAIGALELIFSLFGPGLSHLLEAGLPGLDHDIGHDHDASGLEEVTPLSRLLGWLRVGQVPLLILFVVFLTAFGVIGLVLQYLTVRVAGFLVPTPLAALAAFAAAIPCVRVGGGVIGRILPRDETQAVSEESFIGRIAIITTGQATYARPAEARLQDQFKQTHYIFVAPSAEGEVFPAGTAVLILKKENNLFRVVRNSNSALVD